MAGSEDYQHHLLKASLFLAFLGLIAFANNYKMMIYPVECLYDFGISLTNPVTIYLINHPDIKNAFVIAGSASIDMIIVATMLCWIICGKSWRLIFAIIKFYGIRAVLQRLYNMPYPVNYSFYYPGFPSLLVSYLKTNDFFYSGHTGIPLLCGLEFLRNGWLLPFIFCVISSVFEGCVMVLLHAHYLLDVIVGVLMAHYVYWITETYISKVDAIIGFEYEIGEENDNAKEEYCGKC